MDDFRNDLIEFYTPYFESVQAAETFVGECYQYIQTLRACNQVQRLIGRTAQAATYPINTDSIQIFFWVVCIESLYDRLSIKVLKKHEIVQEFVDKYFTQRDKDFLDTHLLLSATGEPVNVSKLMNDVRNLFAHEGTYWYFSFASPRDNDTNRIQCPPEDEDFWVVSGPDNEEIKVAMSLSEMRDIIVRGTIQFLMAQITELKQGPEFRHVKGKSK